jgi:enoyl-CoA hydratase/carnithine racemase
MAAARSSGSVALTETRTSSAPSSDAAGDCRDDARRGDCRRCELALHCDQGGRGSSSRCHCRLGLALFPLIQLLDTIGSAPAKGFLRWILHADRAARFMVNRLVSLADLERATYELAETIAANAPLTIAAMKRAIHRANGFRRTIEHEDYEAEVARVARRRRD